MYELLVLGMLMSRNMSGYKLRDVLGSALVPRRKISNGVMYPLLSKLEANGDIIFIEEPNDPRNKRLAQITEVGKTHFYQQMAQPVPDNNARNESIYRFKFRGLFAVDATQQKQILQDYADKVREDLNIYNEIHQHLLQLLTQDTSNKEAIHAGIQSIELSMTICEAKQAWVGQYLDEIQNKEQHNEAKNEY
ncbi:PadR family transcriptional regulator [Lactobacillus sp. LC28-10]|uniref:PadR family transcriptional regulator n=1 Tax=Secundilactobacillus angelensis TaxID=2722706 RepID=A0ABX1L0M7_9LACO|nr:PadR family transcriptional regulator [Secundilactobacillus angelensis]MCH5462671.1 PadR family transcriptional regulator [Secundilactobacillus angelensis]NLR18783.1 PadR family transcriptional regulator [Secundilactobacillus angelensis]